VIEARIGCTSVAYLRHPLDRALEGIASCGIENVELASIPRYCDHLPPGRLPEASWVLKRCEEVGLRPVAVSAHGDLKKKSDVSHVAECMRLASELGAGVVNTGTGDTSSSEEEKLVTGAIAELAAIGERVGVTLGMETQNSLFTTGNRSLSIIEEIGSERVRINLDAANIRYWSGNDPLSEVKTMAKDVVHMHVKDHRGRRGDYEFPPLGTGDIELADIVSCLIVAGFEGFLVLEPEPSQAVRERPAAEVRRVRDQPGLAYAEFHSYLGERDAAKVDAELRGAHQYLAKTLAQVNEKRKHA
jgi:sugar phosphate isomerase/epimerase